ncbi:MAG: hypothetical protein FD149_256 [Rhodospirillaceae bacterium]|nr:MAG: hypothetical protein FD149_256 [Rhodospirillaceae bacterium]
MPTEPPFSSLSRSFAEEVIAEVCLLIDMFLDAESPGIAMAEMAMAEMTEEETAREAVCWRKDEHTKQRRTALLLLVTVFGEPMYTRDGARQLRQRFATLDGKELVTLIKAHSPVPSYLTEAFLATPKTRDSFTEIILYLGIPLLSNAIVERRSFRSRMVLVGVNMGDDSMVRRNDAPRNALTQETGHHVPGVGVNLSRSEPYNETCKQRALRKREREQGLTMREIYQEMIDHYTDDYLAILLPYRDLALQHPELIPEIRQAVREVATPDVLDDPLPAEGYDLMRQDIEALLDAVETGEIGPQQDETAAPCRERGRFLH